MSIERSSDPILLRTILDAIPAFIFVVDDDVRILDYNAAAAGLLGEDRANTLRHRAGDLLHCIHSKEVPEGCGHAPVCKFCVIRSGVGKAFAGNHSVRSRAKMDLQTEAKIAEIHVLVTTSPFHHAGKPMVLLVIEDISQITELHQIIPICMYCKKVRTDDQYWHKVETYFSRQWDLKFSHGLCPDCCHREMEKIKALPPPLANAA